MFQLLKKTKFRQAIWFHLYTGDPFVHGLRHGDLPVTR